MKEGFTFDGGGKQSVFQKEVFRLVCVVSQSLRTHPLLAHALGSSGTFPAVVPRAVFGDEQKLEVAQFVVQETRLQVFFRVRRSQHHFEAETNTFQLLHFPRDFTIFKSTSEISTSNGM